MQAEFDDVKTFHGHIGAMIRATPGLLDADTGTARRLAEGLRALQAEAKSLSQHGDDLAARLTLSLEETAEWLEAHAAQDLVAAADAWGDRCYVLLGDAVATGLPAQEVFAAVHRSNMTKVQGRRQASGKAGKDDGFRRPALESLLKDR